MYAQKGNHFITAATEHKAVLDTCKRLEKRGCRVTYLPVRQDGLIDLDQLRDAITDQTVVVSIMYGNNEIGTIQPIREIGKICREKGVLLHTDATQAVGKIPVSVIDDNIDLMSFTAHKMYGPKGVGALYVRRKNPRVQLTAQMGGGGHERGFRSGTLNVPGIAGFGKAAELCRESLPEEMARMSGMRDRLKETLMAELDEVYINGSVKHRLPHNLNISFAYVEGESLLMGINDIAVSSGSACTSATLEPSYVLKALGAGDDLAHSSIRFGVGRFNTDEEIDYTAHKVIDVVRKLRELSPLYEMVREGVDLTKVEWAAH
jgi:cysteine desulfurase